MYYFALLGTTFAPSKALTKVAMDICNAHIEIFYYLRKTLFGMGITQQIAVFFILASIPISSDAQIATDEQRKSLESEFDAVAREWHDISSTMDNYEGLAQYCSSPEYQTLVLASIRKIHHFDSLIMDKLQQPGFVHDNVREEKRTLKSIEEFESEYGIPSFLEHLKDECNARHDIEKHRKETVNEVGSESYSGQVYLVELELYKYIHHIDNRLSHIEKHLHRIHIDDVNGPE